MSSEKEFQRYGRNKETIVDKKYISSGEYRRKFDKITGDNEFARLLYSKAKEMLVHRSGTMLEDMCWFDIDAKSFIASETNANEDSKIVYSSSVLKTISGKGNILTMHTHPHSMSPSIEDFNASCYYNYKEGIVLCHDGTIYRYWSDELIEARLYEQYVGCFMLNSNILKEAQLFALKELRKNYQIDFEEVM